MRSRPGGAKRHVGKNGTLLIAGGLVLIIMALIPVRFFVMAAGVGLIVAGAFDCADGVKK